MRRYLVTGGLGFIGNELVRQLQRVGQVVVLDNGHRRAEHIEDLTTIPLLAVDLTQRAATERALREVKPNVVFHLAAIHFIPECNARPDSTLRVNVEGTLNLLDACASAGVEHVLVASSGAVYRDSPHPLTETAPVSPVDIYGWSKWFVEELCRNYYTHSSATITIARLFNTFGPRETNAHIIPEVIEQLRFSDTIRLGNTSARRDYIFVRDCAAALVRLSQITGSRRLTINVGTGHAVSVVELVRLMGKILGRDLSIVVDQERLRHADKAIQVADISLLKKRIDWSPKVSLRAGLTELLQFEGLLETRNPAATLETGVACCG